MGQHLKLLKGYVRGYIGDYSRVICGVIYLIFYKGCICRVIYCRG